MKRQACRGAGVDCVRFGACVLDELYGDGLLVLRGQLDPDYPQGVVRGRPVSRFASSVASLTRCASPPESVVAAWPRCR